MVASLKIVASRVTEFMSDPAPSLCVFNLAACRVHFVFTTSFSNDELVSEKKKTVLSQKTYQFRTRRTCGHCVYGARVETVT